MKLLSVLLLLCACCFAQTLPDAPSAHSTENKPKVVDKEFLIVSAWMWTSMVADAESTVRGVESGCQELNPLYGTHPTRGKMYAIGIPVTAVLQFFTYKMKQRYPQKRWAWMLPSVSYAGARSGVAVSNFARCR